MKLEVPHLRIMRGEAANLSPCASKLLLILIGCQDKESRTVSRSRNSYLALTGMKKSSFFQAKKELAENKWITLDGPFIQLVQDDGLLVHPGGLLVQPDGQLVQAEKPLVQRGGQTVQADGLKVHPGGHRSDQEIDKDHNTDRISSLVLSIGERYQYSPADYKRLWSICKDAEFEKLSGIFEAMLSHKTRIKDPIAYISVSLGNNGSGQQLFKTFTESL